MPRAFVYTRRIFYLFLPLLPLLTSLLLYTNEFPINEKVCTVNFQKITVHFHARRSKLRARRCEHVDLLGSWRVIAGSIAPPWLRGRQHQRTSSHESRRFGQFVGLVLAMVQVQPVLAIFDCACRLRQQVQDRISVLRPLKAALPRDLYHYQEPVM